MSEEQFESWAVVEINKPFQKWSYKPKQRGENDIDIKIICCGICASDIHQVTNGWGWTHYPIVPGHEIIGIVSAKGNKATKFNIGDRVGVGPQCLSCFTCKECKRNDNSYCSKGVYTYNGKYESGEFTYGGYAKHIRVHEYFAVRIPDNLDSFAAAPLLCAGITTYDPLVRYNVRGKKLGILGVGGLGHMGIKFGVALGNEVIGISRNPDKRDEVLALGATDYIATRDEGQMKKYERYFEYILCTIDQIEPEDMKKYFNLLDYHGTFILVGVPDGPYNMPVNQCVMMNKQIVGSLIGSPAKIEEMLQYCSENNIVSDVQVYPIEKVNEAYEDFKKGKPRYRFVLSIDQ